MRLDLFLSEKYSLTRNKAQAFIKDGLVTVDTEIIMKPSYEVAGMEKITLKNEKKIHWVSRSAGKLDGFLDSLSRHCEEQSEEAIQQRKQDVFLVPGLPRTPGGLLSSFHSDSPFPSQGQEPVHIPRFTSYDLRVTDAHCLDVGSSTGGFTQVLLEHGAAHVDAVDVGTDQLHPSLRNDPRVSSYEQMDIRDFVNLSVPPNYDLRVTNYDVIVCDASFISLTEIFPSIISLADPETEIILLWKPQFEVGRANLNTKTGVPKEEKVIEQRQIEWELYVRGTNCEILHREKSTVFGEAGNVEWLYWVKKL